MRHYKDPFEFREDTVYIQNAEDVAALALAFALALSVAQRSRPATDAAIDSFATWERDEGARGN